MAKKKTMPKAIEDEATTTDEAPEGLALTDPPGLPGDDDGDDQIQPADGAEGGAGETVVEPGVVITAIVTTHDATPTPTPAPENPDRAKLWAEVQKANEKLCAARAELAQYTERKLAEISALAREVRRAETAHRSA